MISLLETDHPDVEELAKQVVRELKAMWVKQDHYIVQMLDPLGKAIYTWGPYYTPLQAKKELYRLSSPGPGSTKGWVQKIRVINDDV